MGGSGGGIAGQRDRCDPGEDPQYADPGEQGSDEHEHQHDGQKADDGHQQRGAFVGQRRGDARLDEGDRLGGGAEVPVIDTVTALAVLLSSPVSGTENADSTNPTTSRGTSSLMP